MARPLRSTDFYDRTLSQSPGSEADHGRRAEFLRLLNEAYPKLYGIAVSMVGSLNDADDVMQEASLILWEKFDSFEPGSSFARWASQVTVNVTRNFCRRRRKHQAGTLGEAALARIAKVRGGVEELLELRRERLAHCLQKLASHERRMLLECYVDETSISDWARAENVSANTVYSQLRRLRRKLYDCINRHLGGER